MKRVVGGGGLGLVGCARGALVLTAVAYLNACGDDCQRPPIGSVALNIQVVDSESGASICDAAVSIQLGDDTRKLSPSCPYTGGTAPGVYTITVTRTGYEEQIVPGVRVDADNCSYAVTKQVKIELVPKAA